jgi:hypothetical protein
MSEQSTTPDFLDNDTVEASAAGERLAEERGQAMAASWTSCARSRQPASA